MDEGLTNEQTDKVLQFQDLTGIEDISICRDVLIRHQWDLEVAIQEQLNMREGRPSMYASAPDNRTLQVVNDRYLQHVFSSSSGITTPQSGLSGLLGYLINYVFNFGYNTFTSILTTILGFFRDTEQITDPVGDVLTFIRNYNEKYPVHPVFYQGTYAQALSDAKRELRFLVVYLHKDNAEANSLCRNSLSDEGIIEYINRHMLFWGCEAGSPEGMRVAHSIAARTYPLMVIIGLRSNKMVIMGRLEGHCSPDELRRRFETVVKDNEGWLNQARAERLERSFTQSLRQQQDEAYEQSLRADQEKERKKQEERDAEMRKLQEAEAERQAELDRKQDIARQKIEMASLVPSEPQTTDPESITVVFKLPNGTRIERRFLKSNSLKDIYNFVFCHPSSPDTFEITTNFPKRVLEARDSKAYLTLTEAGLGNREVLFINDLDA